MNAESQPARTCALAALSALFFVLAARAHGQIVAFGASNISGWNIAPSEATAAQLQAMLQEKGYKVRVLNRESYGNTTVEMRDRVDRDVPQGTSIVILDVGGSVYNDVRIGISRAQAEADLAAIRARLAARHITVIPFSPTDLPAQYRQQDGIELTPEGHRVAAAKLLPEVMTALGPPSLEPPALQPPSLAPAAREAPGRGSPSLGAPAAGSPSPAPGSPAPGSPAPGSSAAQSPAPQSPAAGSPAVAPPSVAPRSGAQESVPDACAADARRLCAAVIEDAAKREACMYE